MAFFGMTRMARYGRFLRRLGGKTRGLGMARLGLPVRRFLRRRVKKTQNKVHSYVRWADKDAQYPGSNGPNEIVETGANQNLVYTFKLDNVVNPTDFTNLYDMYRINKVVLFLESQYDTSASGSTLGIPNGRRVRVVHDYNDANPLTQEDDYLEYSNCKSYYPLSRRGIKITLYPKINNKIENQGGTDAFTSMNSNKLWLNILDDDVPHFGIKIFIPAGIIPGSETAIFKVRAKFHLSLKNSK